MIEKNQSIQGLPLGGGGHLALSCQMRKIPLYILGAKKIRMRLAAEVMKIT